MTLERVKSLERSDRFTTTKWSVVLHEALDLTQGSFAALIEKGLLDAVRPERGKSRSFLLASLKHFIAHERRSEHAFKRGGGQEILPLDGASPIPPRHHRARPGSTSPPVRTARGARGRSDSPRGPREATSRRARNAGDSIRADSEAGRYPPSDRGPDSCQPQPYVVPDNGSGTADLAIPCPYNADSRTTTLHPDGTIFMFDVVSLRSITCPAATPAVCSFPSPIPGVDCSQPGGTPGSEVACADALLTLRYNHYNPLTGHGDRRTVELPVSFEEHAAPRLPGEPVQSFATDLFRISGEITPADMDPDFDLYRVTPGSDFGLPAPGHTTLTQALGDWAVDSFFDITLRIEIVGKQGSVLFSGANGTSEWTARFHTGGGCVYAPVSCDDSDPCTTDACDPDTGSCQFLPAPGASCDDGDSCTENDVCLPGGVGGTTDSCHPMTGCAHQPIPVQEPNPLLFTSQTQFSWPPTPDATHWNAYRGTIPSTLPGSRLPGAVYDHVCHESADAFADGAMVSTDPGSPPAGAARYYPETGEGVCGESVAGLAPCTRYFRSQTG